MISKRQEEIINIILANPNGIYGSLIASKLKVSTRTIRNDINQINTEYKQIIISSNSKVGYFIEEDKMRELGDYQYHDLPDKIYREIRILGEVLLEGHVDLYSLEDELNLTSQTIKKYVNSLNSYKQFLQIKEGELVISINERELRRVIFKIVQKYLVEYKYNPEFLETLLIDDYDDKAFKHLSNVVDNCLMLNNLKLTKKDLICLKVCMYISQVRYHYSRPDVIEVRPLIYSMLYDMLKMELPNLTDRDYFMIDEILYTFKKENQEVTIDDFTKIVLDEFLEEVFNKYSFNIKDSVLYEKMLYHFEYMIRRLKNGYESLNNLKQEIKEKYSYAYEIAMLIVPICYKYFNKYILDDEISYIALYIAHFVENVNVKVSTCLVSTASIVDETIYKWLQTNFANQLEITCVSSLTKEESKNYQLVISTNDFVYFDNVKVYFFKNLPNFDDMSKLNYLIHEVRVKERLEKMLDTYLKEDNIKIYEDNLNFEEIIADLSKTLVLESVIDNEKEFIEDVIKREENYPTLVNNILVPHPLLYVCNNLSISIALVRNGLSIHNTNVNFIFLIALPSKETGYTHILLKYLENLSLDVNKLDHLKNAKDVKSLIKELKNIK